MEYYQTAIQQLRQEQSLLLKKQRGEYEQKLSHMQTLVLEKSFIQSKLEVLKKSYDALEIEHKSLVSQHRKILQQHDSAAEEQNKLQKTYDELMQKFQQQTQQLESKQHEIIELKVMIKTEAQKSTSLEQSLAQANDKIEILRYDYQFIAQEKANLEGQLKQLQMMLSSKKSIVI